MSDGMSFMNLGDLSKPATVLIEKISNAIEGSLRPSQIKRIAKAEAEASIIDAKAQIEIEGLQRRGFIRLLNEEGKKQENIESITEKAIGHMGASSSPERMDDDWIVNFFDKCRIISDEDMQSLWARVLAGEADSPGTYSKRTINCMGSLDKRDTVMFTALCGFVGNIGGSIALVYDTDLELYKEHGITFRSLTHLETIGLIRFDNLAGFKRMSLAQNVLIKYHQNTAYLKFQKSEGNELKVGKVMLTASGEELANVCDSEPAGGFWEYITDMWEKAGIVVTSE